MAYYSASSRRESKSKMRCIIDAYSKAALPLQLGIIGSHTAATRLDLAQE
jgi:hypothetical protein